ncbi:MAG: UDP-N-acetylmuramoyl-L-alanyl-D-glutamate--2,6-diaminopimelate ligase [Alphaproteobacteria bacterium]|jgi:UDP-N-acetylmuramoyl-L-alanyl-D-glutamate--2,6-diaminopimelate ligase|nr:UDP-N-acetylmuramoyl-L-alanyl-D-glutamate--2,6-diaminopimelate ligase [Alphaproteobacteria bacterium]
MKIKDIINFYHNVEHNLSAEVLNKELINITDNSQEVVEGSIFVAIVGEKFNGVDFTPQALDNGALVVVLPLEYKNKLNHENIIFVENTRDFLSRGIFYLNKHDIPENIITISGTNGKSSTSFFVSQFLNYLQIKNMVIGTLGIYIDGKKVQDCLTTPSATTLMEYFKIATKNNIKFVVMESSSHGIEQHRVDGLHFKAVGFTNLTQDHLDYHKTMENYFLAKARLYTSDLSDTSVINIDDEYGDRLSGLAKKSGKKVLDYGFKAKDGLQILEITKHNTSQSVRVLYKNQEYIVNINLMGEFQVYNILCAMGILLNLGFSITELADITPKLQQIEGRLNLILPKNQDKANSKIFVDFAHSPNALEEVLKILKKEEHNKLLVVFGCGGNRDKTKRPIMGAISAKYADIVYITDDNPRFEDATTIRNEIEQGITKRDNLVVHNIAGRKSAIAKAIADLNSGDILLVAGKGHEDYQIIGDKKHHFSDSETILEILGK